MGRRATDRARLIPLLWCLLGSLVNTSVLTIDIRRPHGAVARNPSFIPSAHLGGRPASPPGSVVLTTHRTGSTSSNFGPSEEQKAPELLRQQKFFRSQSYRSQQGTPTGVWSGNGETPSLLQARQQQHPQQEHNREHKRPHGRLARIRMVLSVTRGDESPDETEALTNEESSTPGSVDVSTTSTSATETASLPEQAESPIAPSEKPDQGQEAEEWHEAPTPEQAGADAEEWYDAPEAMSRKASTARS
ncbi:uncharacterized protein EMH_0042060 [Eimeria mitis]|uniref:Uncharacterized protein n=1 Tax=Eimeria mitis TaxID=44415 RepID=U6JSY2_9EIME|nr:uncharacterized protein EMH_0042060 [Eimeria mitis]CDJ28570.1 hypothetical protein EMH_0042060 [Eimeria mitis]